MNCPTLFLVGATHRTAPFAFREKLALGVEGEAALAAELGRIASIREFVILNTCNRVEIYGVATKATADREVVAAFCQLRHVDPLDFERFGFVHQGRAAVEHLLQVASGLDSQILGETEIFGQVKRAYATAQTRHSAGAILNRLFQKTFQAAKHVRTNTGISTGQVSVANVAVDLALSVFGSLAERRLLVLGAGEMAEKSARAFQSRGTKDITVASRRLEHASALAASLEGRAVSFDEREGQLDHADLVVCSTAAPTTILSVSAVRAAIAKRGARPLLLIDLAMPRDIEAGAGAMENVFLYNLDDLAKIAAENRQARLVEAEAGRQTLAVRADALWSQLQIQLVTVADERRYASPPAMTSAVFTPVQAI